MKSKRLESAGFSLVEILVATGILLVIGGVAAHLLMRSFTLWEHGVDSTRRLAATDAFVTQITRDFVSMQGPQGFTGATSRCHFWTLEFQPASTAPQLTSVEYMLTPEAILRRALTAGAAEPRETRYAPVESLVFSYSPPNFVDAAWQTSWSDATNAPAGLLLQAGKKNKKSPYFPRLLLRHTP